MIALIAVKKMRMCSQSAQCMFLKTNGRGLSSSLKHQIFRLNAKEIKTTEKKQNMSKNTGSKSYARLRAEQVTTLGQEPSEYQFWLLTHKSKDGKGMVDAALKVVYVSFYIFRNQVAKLGGHPSVRSQFILLTCSVSCRFKPMEDAIEGRPQKQPRLTVNETIKSKAFQLHEARVVT